MVRTANLFDNPNSRFTFLRYELFPLTCIPMDNNFDKLSQLFISALMLLLDYFLDHNFFCPILPSSACQCRCYRCGCGCTDIYSLYFVLENCTKLLPFLRFSSVPYIYFSHVYVCVCIMYNYYNKKTHIEKCSKFCARLIFFRYAWLIGHMCANYNMAVSWMLLLLLLLEFFPPLLFVPTFVFSWFVFF